MKLLSSSSVCAATKAYIIPAYNEFPNSALHGLPLLIYRPFDTSEESLWPDDIEEQFLKNGVRPQWRYPMYDFAHYHSNTHEVLALYRGKAHLCFGHADNPSAVTYDASVGDVIIIPAGVVHQTLYATSDFSMVGAYPPESEEWDNCRGGTLNQAYFWQKVEELGLKHNRLSQDPIYGRALDSPLARSAWRQSSPPIS